MTLCCCAAHRKSIDYDYRFSSHNAEYTLWSVYPVFIYLLFNSILVWMASDFAVMLISHSLRITTQLPQETKQREGHRRLPLWEIQEDEPKILIPCKAKKKKERRHFGEKRTPLMLKLFTCSIPFWHLEKWFMNLMNLYEELVRQLASFFIFLKEMICPVISKGYYYQL